MPRVPRVPGRSIKLNPLPGPFQKFDVPAAAFGGPDLTAALKHLERLFEQTSNPQKKAAPAPGDSQDDAAPAPIDPQDAIIIDRLQADMAAAGDMFTRAQGAYREATGGEGGLYNLDADTLFSGGTRAEALLEWPTEDFDATGQGFAARLNDPRQRAIFEHLWGRDRAIELPRAEAYIRGREAEFRQGALARFWEGADRTRDELTLMVEGNWRNYKAVAEVYAERLKDGLTIGASAEDVGARAAIGVEALNHAALIGWFKEAPDADAALEAFAAGDLGDPQAQVLYDRLSEKARDRLHGALRDEHATEVRLQRNQEARAEAAQKAEMDGLVADFFYGDETAPINADDRLPHALLVQARLSPHVTPATVTAMEAHLDDLGISPGDPGNGAVLGDPADTGPADPGVLSHRPDRTLGRPARCGLARTKDVAAWPARRMLRPGPHEGCCALGSTCGM